MTYSNKTGERNDPGRKQDRLVFRQRWEGGVALRGKLKGFYCGKRGIKQKRDQAKRTEEKRQLGLMGIGRKVNDGWPSSHTMGNDLKSHLVQLSAQMQDVLFENHPRQLDSYELGIHYCVWKCIKVKTYPSKYAAKAICSNPLWQAHAHSADPSMPCPPGHTAPGSTSLL